MRLRPRSTIVFLILYFISIFLKKSKSKRNVLLIKPAVSFIISFSKDHYFLFEKMISITPPLDVARYKKIEEVEIHSVICHKDVPQYILCIKSLIKVLKYNIETVVHDDGSLTQKDVSLLKHHLPGLIIIKYKDASRRIEPLIKKYRWLYRERLEKNKNKYHLLTILDVPYFAKSKKIIYLDSDIVFFKKPQALLNWIQDTSETEYLYMHDWNSYYTISEQECRKYFFLDYIPRVNMGIFCLYKKTLTLTYLNFYFKTLEKIDKNDRTLRDQTYWMLHLQKFKLKYQHLEKKYLVPIKSKINNKTVCCHYVTPVRHSLYTAGINMIVTGHLFS